MNRIKMRGCEGGEEEGGERDERWSQPWKETEGGEKKRKQGQTLGLFKGRGREGRERGRRRESKEEEGG